MSRQEKLLKRLASKPKDFTWSELCKLMSSLGIQLSKASGSARKFINPATDGRFNIHEPHPTGGLPFMNTTVSYRGFDGSIIHDPEDHLYHGKILGIRDFVIYHGDTPEEAASIFREAVDEYLSDFEKNGKEPPTPFASLPADMPHELRLKAALYAHEHHVQIESVLDMTLSQLFDQAA